MSTKLTSKLLQDVADLTARKAKLQQKLTEAFEERYGVTYSAVDSDELIDVLDYHGGHINLKLADEAMFRAGYPALSTPTSQP